AEAVGDAKARDENVGPLVDFLAQAELLRNALRCRVGAGAVDADTGKAEPPAAGVLRRQQPTQPVAHRLGAVAAASAVGAHPVSRLGGGGAGAHIVEA